MHTRKTCLTQKWDAYMYHRKQSVNHDTPVLPARPRGRLHIPFWVGNVLRRDIGRIEQQEVDFFAYSGL
jgi:hypothetical protein